MTDRLNEIECTLNLSPDQVDRLSIRYRDTSYFVGYRDGFAWFVGMERDEQTLKVVSSPFGLIVRGRVEPRVWTAWLEEISYYALTDLGVLLKDTDSDPYFVSTGRPFLTVQLYEKQISTWPKRGKHILAQSDDRSVVVYQAYRPSIGKFAAANQKLGGDGFSFERMSWIKTNFLWMMYRSGWGTKQDQEATLAIRLRREAFDEILSQAVPSTFDSSLYSTESEWQGAVSQSDVRIQWDPDHAPSGAKRERRAIQLGLRGSVLKKFAGEWIVGVCDISDFVAKQGRNHRSKNIYTPEETIYRPERSVAERLGMWTVG